MADDETKTKVSDGETAESEVLSDESLATTDETPAEDAVSATHLGSAKYVHAAFFVVGLVAAFIFGRVLEGIWNALAAWPTAVHAVPQLLQLGEDERPFYTMVAGFAAGLIVIVQLFRNPGVRKWSDDVAVELSKVVWPSRETVTNGTIVVVVASAIATIYVGLLDRLWGFVTTLVYGA
jgi:preprotein translocase subunit SecE